MKTIINPETVIWILGVIQPASISEMQAFWGRIFHDLDASPSQSALRKEIERQLEAGRVMCVSRDPPLYSLTYAGHLYLPLKLRAKRDKVRIYLLNTVATGTFVPSREDYAEGSAGVAPALDTSTTIKGTAANMLLGLRSSGQKSYWPRFAERLTETGPTAASRDTFRFLSFASEEQVRKACGLSDGDALFTSVGLGVSLGVSPKLITHISLNRKRHYRSFFLKKKGGGERQIDSPRIFLKTIQRFLASYVFHNLAIHDAVHSYRHQRSTVTNAMVHEHKQFVGNTDIRNFFGSVSTSRIRELLLDNLFHEPEAIILSRLCTKDNALPQGAPTSPILSNACLYPFDDTMVKYCAEKNMSYTRYADDITISGTRRGDIDGAIRYAARMLKTLKLNLNAGKTRIASRDGQQRVTGAVVNTQATPPRRWRRELRAMLHNAELGLLTKSDLMELRGKISYLNAFPKYRDSQLISEYRAKLEIVSAQRERQLPRRPRHRSRKHVNSVRSGKRSVN